MLITPASPQHTAFNPLVPALDLNVDLLERRPGYRAWYNTFEPRDLRGRPSTGASFGSSSSSFSADHTDSSASFHSDWVDQDELPFEPFPLLEPMSGLSSTSTTTTGTSDVYFPVMASILMSPPVLCPPAFSLQLLACHLAHFVSTIRLTCVLSVRDVYTTHCSASLWPFVHVCVSTLEPTHGASTTMRCFAQFAETVIASHWFGSSTVCLRPDPRVLEVISDLDFHALLAAAGLPPRRDVATVNGNA